MRLFLLPPALILSITISQTLAEEVQEARTTTSSVTSTTHLASTTITLTRSGPNATPTSFPATPKMSSLNTTVLNSTNTYRTNYLASPLTWNTTLASFASSHAEKCVFEHSGGPYGENLAASFETPTLAIDAWANEEDSYNYRKKKFSEKTGHFTQLVWQSTTDVGCANVDCTDEGLGEFLVCEYWPRGNVQGGFGENVRKAGMSEDGKLGVGSAGERMNVGWLGVLVGVLGVVGLVL